MRVRWALGALIGLVAISASAQHALPFLQPEIPAEPPASTARAVLSGGVAARALVVTNSADSGAGTLRQVLADANSGDSITFDLRPPAIITLTSGELQVGKDLVIRGPGASRLTVRRSGSAGTADFRMFHIGRARVELSGLTVENGRAPEPATGDVLGGGIYNRGTLSLHDVVLRRNEAPSIGMRSGFGGGIFSLGPLSITSSTISGNVAGGAGGGVFVFHETTLAIASSTVSSNRAGLQGGGIELHGSTGTVRNSTVSGNVADGFGGGGGILNLSFPSESSALHLIQSTVVRNAGQSGGGVMTAAFSGAGSVQTTVNETLVAENTVQNFAVRGDAQLISEGHNLDSDGSSGFVNGTMGDLVGSAPAPLNPRIGPLADNGGPTATHALLRGSPAVDAGNCPAGSGAAVDQRGVRRPQGAACDIGAFELDAEAPHIVRITASPDVLWPPNHRLVPVEISVVTDPADGPVDCRIVSVTSMENGKLTGRRFSRSSSIIIDRNTVLLRAERSGRSRDGRVYTIAVECRDLSGNVTTGATRVLVPHDQRPGSGGGHDGDPDDDDGKKDKKEKKEKKDKGRKKD